MGEIPLWSPEHTSTNKKNITRSYRNICITSILAAFAIGFLIGVTSPSFFHENEVSANASSVSTSRQIFQERQQGVDPNPEEGTAQDNQQELQTNPDHLKYLQHSLEDLQEATQSPYHTVTFVEDNGVIEENIFWGRKVEELLPVGFTDKDNSVWNKYVQKSMAVRLEPGCGRMQNRLVTFQDGSKGCVRYRQNLDQIQGELFSFYLAQLLEIPNLAPSTVSLVDLSSTTWKNLPSEVASAQWASNRPIVVTKYISDLSNANIPQGFRPPERQLTKKDILDRNYSSTDRLTDLAELAQWSDLIIFDYLTANLDRVVNNLYNRQWNVNIMEAPAHNLARRDDNLLVFLDNESGLLHGYRLLHKYEPYHSLLLDNLCVFRRKTIAALERLRRDGNVGQLLTKMFEEKTSGKVRDVLPFLPEKSVKILNERIERVHGQISRCKRLQNGL